MKLPSILSSIKCILPCAWPLLTLLVGVFYIRFIRGRLMYAGILPSDGPEEGFESKSTRIEFWDSTDRRTRETIRAMAIFVPVAVIGTGIIYLVTKFL